MWQPDNTTLHSIVSMIRQSTTGTSNARQREIATQIEAMSRSPDFPTYLAHILHEPSLPLNLRLSAGHYLKSVIERLPKPLSDSPHFEGCILDALGIPEVSAATASIAAALYTAKDGWPRLLQLLGSNLQSSLSLNTLLIILQDINSYSALAHMTDSDPYYSILNSIVPGLTILAESGNACAVLCLNQLLILQPRVLAQYNQSILQVLLRLTQTGIAAQVSQAFLSMSNNRKDLLSKCFDEVALFMLSRLNSKPAVAFFTEWSDQKSILRHLPSLLKGLVQNLRLSEQDLMQLMPEQGQMRLAEDQTGNWTLRKESAALLDCLAHTYKSPCFFELQGLIQELLCSQDWVSVQSGLLALGSISIGCYAAVQPTLGTLVPFLLKFLGSNEPLVKSMGIWCVSRYSEFLVHSEYFLSYLQALMAEMLGSSQSVQVSACTSVCVLTTQHGDAVYPHIDRVFQTVNTAFGIYKGKTILNLLDVIATAADAYGSRVGTAFFYNATLPILFQLWAATNDDSKLIWTLCETLASVYLAVGGSISSYNPAVIQRCQRVAQLSLPPRDLQKQYAIKALELAGTVLETQQNLPGLMELADLIVTCLADKDISMRQYAAATAGDLIIVTKKEIAALYPLMIERLTQCLVVIAGNASDVAEMFGMCCNNAACALSEIAVYASECVRPYSAQIISSLMQVISQKFEPEQAKYNIIAALGNFGLVDPNALAGVLEGFFDMWCDTIASSPSSIQKEMSTKGVLAALSVNPSVLDTKFRRFAEAMLAYDRMPQEVEAAVRAIMQAVKQFAGERWEAYVGMMPFRGALQLRYQVQVMIFIGG